MKYLIKILIFQLISYTSLSQKSLDNEIDSLERVINKLVRLDTNRINLMINLEYCYIEANSNKYGRFANEIFELSTHLKFSKGIVHSNVINSIVAMRKSDFINALKFAQQALKIALVNKEPNELLICYKTFGLIYLQKTNGNDAGDINKAIKYFKNMVFWSHKGNDYNTISSSYQNLALAYLDANRNKEALEALNSSLNVIKGKNLPILETFLLNLKGRALIQNKRFDEALAPLKQAEFLAQKYNVNRIKMPIYYHLGNVYRHKNLFDISEKYYVKSVSAVSKDNLIKALDPLKELTAINELQKDYKSALWYNNEYLRIKDSLVTEEKNRAFLELENKYETQQKVKQIEVLKYEQELANSQKKTYLGIAALLVLLLLGAFFAMWQINKAKLKVEKANYQRDRLFAIVAHDLRSPAASLRRIISKINFVLKKNDPKATNILSTSIEDSATALYTLVDNLLHWSLLQQGKIKIASTFFVLTFEIKEVLQSLMYRANQKHIGIQFDDTNLKEVFADRMLVQTIVRNLLDNAIKFTPENGIIKIEINEKKNYVEFCITDSGVGISEEIQKVLFDGDATQKNNIVGTQGEKGKGIGLYLCNELAKMNGFELRLIDTSKQGTTFVLIIPDQ